MSRGAQNNCRGTLMAINEFLHQVKILQFYCGSLIKTIQYTFQGPEKKIKPDCPSGLIWAC